MAEHATQLVIVFDNQDGPLADRGYAATAIRYSRTDVAMFFHTNAANATGQCAHSKTEASCQHGTPTDPLAEPAPVDPVAPDLVIDDSRRGLQQAGGLRAVAARHLERVLD